jgi:NhaP-type Na+/H+ or K+/H+ antiporter
MRILSKALLLLLALLIILPKPFSAKSTTDESPSNKLKEPTNEKVESISALEASTEVTNDIGKSVEEPTAEGTPSEHPGSPTTQDPPAEPEKHATSHERSKEVITVFTILIILLISSLCREIKKLTGIPYTPLLLIAGMVCGGYSYKLWEFGQGLEMILSIDPHGILLIFIPILVFEAAYNTDLYFFKKEFYQVILLAGPGVVIGAIMLALIFNYGLGYSEEFNMFGGLTFGSIICATDTVAVLALLKELGTPKYFSMLFEGENLLNDATAMVFYMIFSDLFKAKGVTTLGATLQFLRLSVGGFVLGSLMFLIVILWLRKITKDKILVITITFLSCYLTFFLAENVVKVSGLLSVVVLGVLMAMHAKMRMNPETLETIHIVISFIQFCLESILFLITGVFIGKMYIFQDKNTLEAADYTKSLIFFLAMNVARYVMINMLLPLINKSGYPLNWKDVIVLSYGGVRGALGLALALIVYRDTDYSPRFRDLVLYYVAVVIVLTVIFNGLTIGYIMRLINFAPVNPLTYKIRNNVLKNVIVSSLKKNDTIKGNKFLKLANWEVVTKISGVDRFIKLHEEEVKKMDKANQKQLKVDKEREMKGLKSPIREDEFEKMEVEEVRMRFYTIIKSVIYEKFEEDFCSIPTLKNLHEILEECMEDLSKPLWIFENVSQELMSVEEIMKLIWLKKIPIIGRFTNSYFSRFFLNTYEKLSVLVMVLTQILDERPEIPLNFAIVNMVMQEVYKNKSKFESRLFYLCDLFPDFISNVQSNQAAQIILNNQRSVIHDSYANGYISEDDYDKLTNVVEKGIANLDVQDYDWGKKDINELELIEPSFSKLSKEHMKLIKDTYVKCDFKMGQVIFSSKEPVKGLYIIIKGIVEDNLSLEVRLTLGVGGIISFANIVAVDGKCLTTLKCIKDCTAYLVPKETIQTIAEADKDFLRYIHKSALYYNLKIYSSVSFNQNLNDSMIMILVDSSEMMLKSTGEMLSVEGGGFLFKGSIKPVGMGVNEPTGKNDEQGSDRNTLSPPSKGSPMSGRFFKQNMSGVSIVSAPLLLNPLMSGYYKVVEPIIYFSFKNANIGEEYDNSLGSMRFSVKGPVMGSMNVLTKRGSLQKRLQNTVDIDKEFARLVGQSFPSPQPSSPEGRTDKK